MMLSASTKITAGLCAISILKSAQYLTAYQHMVFLSLCTESVKRYWRCISQTDCSKFAKRRCSTDLDQHKLQCTTACGISCTALLFLFNARYVSVLSTVSKALLQSTTTESHYLYLLHFLGVENWLESENVCCACTMDLHTINNRKCGQLFVYVHTLWSTKTQKRTAPHAQQLHFHKTHTEQTGNTSRVEKHYVINAGTRVQSHQEYLLLCLLRPLRGTATLVIVL